MTSGSPGSDQRLISAQRERVLNAFIQDEAIADADARPIARPRAEAGVQADSSALSCAPRPNGSATAIGRRRVRIFASDQ